MSSDQTNQLRTRLEIGSWIFTLLLVVAVMAPIFINNIPYPFYLQNTLIIIVFVTVVRYAFLYKHTWIYRRRWIMRGIIASSVITIFILATSMMDFRNYMDEVGLQEVVAGLSPDRQYKLIKYIQSEVLFFGTGSILGLMALVLRLTISLWKMRNSVTNP